jgi:hypothetical protein
VSNYETWIDHALDRMGVIPKGETFDLLDEDDLDRYARVITREGVGAVVRTATAIILIATPPYGTGGRPKLSNPDNWGIGANLDLFDPENRDEDTLPHFLFPMVIVHGPSLVAKAYLLRDGIGICPRCGRNLHHDYFDGNHDAPIIVCVGCDYYRQGNE